jgi:DUF971 family protein
MPPTSELKPTSLRREGDGLVIDWSDGAKTFATWRTLRKACPCASCNEVRAKPADPFKLVSDTELAAGSPQPVKMLPRGHYAYQIVWNDGHDTGIYTLELLRRTGEAKPS